MKYENEQSPSNNLNDSISVQRQLNMINKNDYDIKSNSLKPLSQPTNFNYEMNSGAKLFPGSASQSTIERAGYIGDDQLSSQTHYRVQSTFQNNSKIPISSEEQNMLNKKREGMSKTPVSNQKIGSFPQETVKDRNNKKVKKNDHENQKRNDSSVDEQEVMQNAVKVINRIVSQK